MKEIFALLGFAFLACTITALHILRRKKSLRKLNLKNESTSYGSTRPQTSYNSARAGSPRTKTPTRDPTLDKPQSFGYKVAWLAVKSDFPESLVTHLQLIDVEKANWKSAMEILSKGFLGAVFVSPSINGWVYTVGAIPPLQRGSRDACLPLLLHLGKYYEIVCHFESYRVSDYYAWARVDQGELTRAFAISSYDIFCDFGQTTQIEDDLDLYGNEDEDDCNGHVEIDGREVLCNEEAVLEIAGDWSLNPIELDNMDLPLGVGWIGKRPDVWPGAQV